MKGLCSSLGLGLYVGVVIHACDNKFRWLGVGALATIARSGRVSWKER